MPSFQVGELKMDLRPQIARRHCLAAAALLFTHYPGCMATNPFLAKEQDPAAVVCQAIPVWDPRVAFAPDPVRGGALAPGIVGRLYLFGPEIDFPLLGDGSITVDL